MSNEAKRIKEVRLKLGLSQAEMGEALKVSRLTIGRWERGETEPKAKYVRAVEVLAKAKRA